MALSQTTVASNDLGIKIAGKVLENLYANNFTPVGYVVNADYQGFSTDTFTVGITRIARPGGTTRTIGAASNGGFFNSSDVRTPTNSSLPLYMDRLYDQVFDIPYALEDSVPYSYVESISTGIAGEVGEQMGADTLKEMYVAVTANSSTNAIKYGASGTGVVTDIFQVLTKGNKILSEGNVQTGDRAFPATNRSLVAVPSVFEDLLNSNKYILTGSDRAFEKLDSGFQGVKYETFKGVIGGLASFQCPSSLMPSATTGSVLGFIDHPSAVTRAYYDRGVRAIPSPVGQGTRLQPYYRWGVKAVRPAGIVGIVTANWTQA